MSSQAIEKGAAFLAGVQLPNSCTLVALCLIWMQTTFHMHVVMNINQKHLRMQMMVQVHTSKLHVFVLNVG